jgi:hypothetical protein
MQAEWRTLVDAEHGAAADMADVARAQASMFEPGPPQGA